MRGALASSRGAASLVLLLACLTADTSAKLEAGASCSNPKVRGLHVSSILLLGHAAGDEDTHAHTRSGTLLPPRPLAGFAPGTPAVASPNAQEHCDAPKSGMGCCLGNTR